MKWNDWNEAFGGGGKSNPWAGMAANGDQRGEAQRQRAAGVYAPSNRGYQPQGLKPGDPGFYEGRSKTYLWRDSQGGFDSLLKSMEGGESASTAVQQLLTQFKGSPDELADFLERAGPLFGTLESQRLEKGPAYRQLADESQWDLGAMSGYGAAAGQIGRGTRQAVQGAQQGLASQGLGRGSANNAITAMLRQQGTNQQGDLQSQLIQQAARNRQASANNLFDAHRTIAQMALGQGITPRIQSPQTEGGVGMAQGAAAGAGIGMAAGPWGALIGGLAGAGYGAYSSRK